MEYHYRHCGHLKNKRKYCEQAQTYKFDNLDKMDQFLERYKLTQLIQCDIDNLNTPITIKKIKFIIKKKSHT